MQTFFTKGTATAGEVDLRESTAADDKNPFRTCGEAFPATVAAFNEQGFFNGPRRTECTPLAREITAQKLSSVNGLAQSPRLGVGVDMHFLCVRKRTIPAFQTTVKAVQACLGT